MLCVGPHNFADKPIICWNNWAINALTRMSYSCRFIFLPWCIFKVRYEKVSTAVRWIQMWLNRIHSHGFLHHYLVSGSPYNKCFDAILVIYLLVVGKLPISIVFNSTGLLNFSKKRIDNVDDWLCSRYSFNVLVWIRFSDENTCLLRRIRVLKSN